MFRILNIKNSAFHTKRAYVKEFGKNLNVYNTNESHDGIIRLSPKDDIKEHDRAVEFLSITQELNRQQINYIISKDGVFHICNLQR